MVGGAGIDAVSSAQLRPVGTGVEHSGAGLEGGETRDGGRKTAAKGGSDMSMAVKDGGDKVTARLGPGWGELGGWDMVGGCSSVSRCVLRHSWAVGCGLGWGRAGDTAVVDGHVVDDVAGNCGGSGFATGFRGAKWGELGRLGRVCRRLDSAVCRSRVLPMNFVVTGRCDVVA